MIGQKFGNWTILREMPNYSYECQCDCGRKAIRPKTVLKMGKTLKCRVCAIKYSKKHFNTPIGKGVELE